MAGGLDGARSAKCAETRKSKGESLFAFRIFALRRLYGLALIADGIAHVFCVRLGLGLIVARAIGRARGRRLTEADW